jgi:hypothetical protein
VPVQLAFITDVSRFCSAELGWGGARDPSCTKGLPIRSNHTAVVSNARWNTCYFCWSFLIIWTLTRLGSFQLFHCPVFCCTYSLFVLLIAGYVIRQIFIHGFPNTLRLVGYAYQLISLLKHFLRILQNWNDLDIPTMLNTVHGDANVIKNCNWLPINLNEFSVFLIFRARSCIISEKFLSISDRLLLK